MFVLIGTVILWTAITAQAADEPEWDCFSIHPWAFVTEQQLSGVLNRPAETVECWGLRSDWVTAAVGIKTEAGTHVLTATVLSPGVLNDRVRLRIVGMGNSRHGGFVPDPLFDPGDFLAERPLTSTVGNWDLIREFPRFRVAREHPALLWLTIHTQGVPAGVQVFKLELSDEEGRKRACEIRVRVLDAELPEQNPLYSFLCSYVSGEDWIREYLEHGVNVFHVEQEAAHKAGAKFLLFTAPTPCWKLVTPIDDAVREQVKRDLEETLKTVDRLGLRDDEWALYLTDEPNEKKFPTLIEYGRFIRSCTAHRVPMYVTMPWSPVPGGTRNAEVSPEGVKTLADSGLIDVWHPYWYHAHDGSGALDIMKATGKPVWLYEILADVPRDPKCGMSFWRLGSWHAYRYGVQGLGVYSGYAPEGDPWNDCDNAHDYQVVYHYGKRGVVSTRAFEAWRQGIQEYKILYRLKEAGVPGEWIREQVEEALGAHTPEKLDAIRLRLAERLVEASHGKGVGK